MKITLAYQDAFRQPISGRDDRKDVALQQFADAGLRLDGTEAHQITCGSDEYKARDKYAASFNRAKSRCKPNDLIYVDYEPANYTHEDQFNHGIMHLTAEFLDQTKGQLPHLAHADSHLPINPASVYGLPASKWFDPHTNNKAHYGFQQTHRQSTGLEWFGPQFYIPYNLDQQPGMKTLNRLLKMQAVCKAVDPTVPMIPFIQPVIRHPKHDRLRMTDETIVDMWVSLLRAGVDRVIWWYTSGGAGEYVDDHGENIKRHKDGLMEAYSIVWPR